MFIGKDAVVKETQNWSILIFNQFNKPFTEERTKFDKKKIILQLIDNWTISNIQQLIWRKKLLTQTHQLFWLDILIKKILPWLFFSKCISIIGWHPVFCCHYCDITVEYICYICYILTLMTVVTSNEIDQLPVLSEHHFRCECVTLNLLGETILHGPWVTRSCRRPGEPSSTFRRRSGGTWPRRRSWRRRETWDVENFYEKKIILMMIMIFTNSRFVNFKQWNRGEQVIFLMNPGHFISLVLGLHFYFYNPHWDEIGSWTEI